MTVGEPQPRTLKAGEHLQLLRLLAAELERAMQAISDNNLPEFQDSIAAQQDMCARLAQVAEGAEPCAASACSSRDSIPAALTEEIRAAAAELEHLNLRYSYLLKYSSRSVAMMVSLFHSFQGQLKEGSGAGSKMQTWSCQA